jgi:hypothetical protein
VEHQSNGHRLLRWKTSETASLRFVLEFVRSFVVFVSWFILPFCLRINSHVVVGRQTSKANVGRVLAGQFGNHFRELTTGTVSGIRLAKILEDLQQSLLLIEKSEMFPGAIGLAEEPLGDDRQSPIG